MRKEIKFGIISAIVIIIGVSAFYLASPLFISTEIDEPLPEGAELSPPSNQLQEFIAMSEEERIEAGNQMGEQERNQIMLEFTRMNTSIDEVIPIESGSNVLRLEDLVVTNGPDLYVYLSTDKSASDFVNLGRLKANIGNQNYEVPEGTDLTKYGTVLIWCKAFSVLFGSADLKSQ
jgi:hypothetical protein